MHHLDILLCFSVDGHKPHTRACHRLANRLRVVAIVLIALIKLRLYVLGRHKLYRVAQFDQLPRPIMRHWTGLHADEAGRRSGHYATAVTGPCLTGLEWI